GWDCRLHARPRVAASLKTRVHGRACSPSLYVRWLPQARSKSITRMIATLPPVFSVSSGRPLLQLHTSPFLATNSMPGPCLIWSSPSAQWQTMSFVIPGFDVFAFGWYTTSRIETVLYGGIIDGRL